MTSYAAQLSCANCTATDGISQVCSECGQLCCTVCSREPVDRISVFNAPYILCGMCFESNSIATTLGQCEQHHGRYLYLYCLTCDMQICCDCFILLADHKRHTIDSVETIYRQKLLETVEKFQEIPRRLKLIDWNAIRQVDTNLEIVEYMEKRILMEVHDLVQQRTASLLSLTTEKKEALVRIKEIVSRTEMQQLEAMKQIRELNTSNFLRLQQSLHQRCEQILQDVEQLHMQPVIWDDIQCDLIPVCKMHLVYLDLRPDTDHPVSVEFYDDCGIQWTALFHLEPLVISLEIRPTHGTLDAFHFIAMIETCHPTRITKSVASVSFAGGMERNKLLSIGQLQHAGYLSEERFLKLRVGVRLENIVDEKKVLKTLLLEEQKVNSYSKMEKAALKEQNFILQREILQLRANACQTKVSYETLLVDKKIEHRVVKEERCTTPNSQASGSSLVSTNEDKQQLILDMKRLQVKLDGMKHAMKLMNPYAIGSFEIYRFSKESKFYSPHLTSYNGITIFVIIQPNFFNENSSAVNANICWAKGPKKNCEVFIEVVNEYEKDCIREDRVFDFSKGTSFTWKNVITHFALFNGKGGFLADDNLKIKFGLRPKLE
ncbi:uncharacterized protein LOC129733346 [Wyeomyia smithii]|uniref:uncharacterized protein LOC129733346 n=1 Tax=Wyeomyia smithii TaxID=174621 RepID=UPI0024681D4E|nr:uncharacterized protein LOC129733346 [Wyeomyia smithii]